MLQTTYSLGIFSPWGTTTCPQRKFVVTKRVANIAYDILTQFLESILLQLDLNGVVLKWSVYMKCLFSKDSLQCFVRKVHQIDQK